MEMEDWGNELKEILRHFLAGENAALLDQMPLMFVWLVNACLTMGEKSFSCTSQD